jgi:hypothetical protein
MKKLLFLTIMALLVPVLAFANPFLVCDPQETVTMYDLETNGTVTEDFTAEPDGSAKINLAGLTKWDYWKITTVTDEWVKLAGSLTKTAAMDLAMFIKGSHNNCDADYWYIDDTTVKPYTHLGEDAVTIVSTTGGDTQNWESVDDGFDPNDAAMTYGFDLRKFGFPRSFRGRRR